MIEALDYFEGIHEGYKNDGRANDSFYPLTNRCPFCQRELSEEFSNGIIEYDPENKDSTQDVHHSVTAKSCECGWWTVEHVEMPDAHNLYAPASWCFAYRGALRKFSTADATIPMDALRGAIARHPDAIGIALELIDAGATVYITGRSVEDMQYITVSWSGENRKSYVSS